MSVKVPPSLTFSSAATSQGFSGRSGNHSQTMMVLSAAPDTRAAGLPAIALTPERLCIGRL